MGGAYYPLLHRTGCPPTQPHREEGTREDDAQVHSLSGLSTRYIVYVWVYSVAVHQDRIPYCHHSLHSCEEVAVTETFQTEVLGGNGSLAYMNWKESEVLCMGGA